MRFNSVSAATLDCKSLFFRLSHFRERINSLVDVAMLPAIGSGPRDSDLVWGMEVCILVGAIGTGDSSTVGESIRTAASLSVGIAHTN